MLSSLMLYGMFEMDIKVGCTITTWKHNIHLNLTRDEQIEHNSKVNPEFKTFNIEYTDLKTRLA